MMRSHLSSRDRHVMARAVTYVRQAAGWCGRPLNPAGRRKRLQPGEDVCGDGTKDAQAHASWSRRRAIHDTVESLGMKPLTGLLEYRQVHDAATCPTRGRLPQSDPAPAAPYENVGASSPATIRESSS